MDETKPIRASADASAGVPRRAGAEPPLRVLHVATYLRGGAGMGTRRIHEGLLRAGADSRVLCASAEPGDGPPEVEVRPLGDADWRREPRPPGPLRRLLPWRSPAARAAAAAREIFRAHGVEFSPAFTPIRLDREPCVRAADVVHLHWIGGFVDVPSFLRACRGRPVVWSLRDENPLLGGFHYRSDVPKGLSAAHLRADREQAEAKRRAVAAHGRVAFVALSEELAAFARTRPVCAGCRVFTVPNPVSDEVAAAPPPDPAAARAALGLPPDAAVLLFAAQYLHEERKGLAKMAEAVVRLRAEGRRAVLVAVGRPTHRFPLPEGTVLPGFLDAPGALVPWYHAADVFANPSLSEGCCKTLLDAAGCGTPAVAFPHAGAREAIGGSGGVVAEGFTVDALVDALRRVLDARWDRVAIRERALALFSPESVARRHLDIYRSMLPGTTP